MVSSLCLHLQITLCVLLLSLPRAHVAVVDPVTELSLNLAGGEMYDDVDDIGMEDSGYDGDVTAAVGRRSLFWQRMRYYISYGALSANRVPCPPRSGRSYYTHDCWRASGPVRPYTRGCSAITRCRR
ncbi:putative rapid ALkalinization Factor [Helianthus annuus]|uniref:Putative ralf-like 34 n=1 Tax=Helianthus annuus TaxID=4232 RepID=A0A251SC41_HELAN|nr:protein RALF-like 34 [Helianthus annuus]KAF5766305.1 putative rapid ALkalinization Factor [Helianthus annuus]KAJ0452716.1 putative rapid ALkalinization Factor [Helianthus annuus]KAJ0457696.1 putative rapid ALkalinization Factor [Helianthus annuus]KAJ0474626.1 putative rapid ALkalinization Factor [Helianthus annuus]KAJ0650183.1 putative rapid ALkalinization Factor [Helianthus annuus]